MTRLKSSTSALPFNWRSRLPDPTSYYSAQVDKLGPPSATGWASGLCPLHRDRTASLSVCLLGARGLWKCHAGCGHGDMVSFTMRKHDLDFADAVRALLRWRA